MAESLAQGRLQSVVRAELAMPAISASRRKLATARRIGEQPAGIEPPLIGITGIEIGWPSTVPAMNTARVRFRIKRGRRVPLVPTYPTSNSQSVPELECCRFRVPILRIRKFQRR